MRAAGERGSEVGIEMADRLLEIDGGRGRRDLHHAQLRAVRAVCRARAPAFGRDIRPRRSLHDGRRAARAGVAAGSPFDRASRLAALPGLLARRILVLDGAMGTDAPGLRFSEADFRGERFRDHPRDLRGNSDLLCLTQPRRPAIHAGYLDAGREIISTNSFTATRIAQADYGFDPRPFAS
jgi:hypothetical protein